MVGCYISITLSCRLRAETQSKSLFHWFGVSKNKDKQTDRVY